MSVLLPNTKVCTRCERELELDQFHKYSRNKDGLQFKCKDCRKLEARKAYILVKNTVMDHYGWICACCGEDNPFFLSIDHIDNDGAEHRREVGKGHVTWKWIIDNDFPDSLQVLCYNCNCGKRVNRGICPHLGIVGIPVPNDDLRFSLWS